MEDYLTDGSEVLFRQIHPTFVVDGYPSSQPFQPTEKDDNKLSVDRSAVTDAASAFALYARNGHRPRLCTVCQSKSSRKATCRVYLTH